MVHFKMVLMTVAHLESAEVRKFFLLHQMARTEEMRTF